MSDVVQFFRPNPGAMVMTMLIGISTFVLGILAITMSRSGASLRPIVFLAGFFAIVIVPQALLHYGQAFGWLPRKDLAWVAGGSPVSNWAAREELLVVQNNRFANPVTVYGPELDSSLVVDLRERLGNIFGNANAAEMAVLRSGASVILAQFNDAAAATESLQRYAETMIGAVPPVESDGTRTVLRANETVKLLAAGRTLVAYIAPSAVSAKALLETSPIVHRAAPAAATDKAEPQFWLYRVPVLITMTIALMLIAVAWFFRMSSWAAEVPAVAGTAPVAIPTLRERILAINSLDVPYSIAPSPEDKNVLIATWRYADAKWMDIARVHGMRRTHRIIMTFDENGATVRPTEQMAAMDWSAGAGGASLRWMTTRGITFFQYEHQRLFGLQLDSGFKFTPKLSYAYTFNLQEMKAPIIEAVTRSGWRWRPVLLNGPSWLHWLTH